MSRGIQYKATNQDTPEETPFSLNQCQVKRGVIYYQNKAGQSP